VVASVLAGVLAGVAACSAEPVPPDTPGQGLTLCDDSYGGHDDWPPEGPTPIETPERHYHCLQVPIQSGGHDIVLQVVIVTDSTEDSLGSRHLLVFHPGGPGINPIDVLTAGPPAVDLSTTAVMAWSGWTAGDGPGECSMTTRTFITDRTGADYANLAPVVAKDCFETSIWTGARGAADELETIRQALGVDRFDFLAISYGTAVAEAYLWKYPRHIRRAALDAPLGLDVPWVTRVNEVARVANGRAKVMATAAAGQPYGALRDAIIAASPNVGNGALELSAVMIDQATLFAMRDPVSEGGWAGAVEDALSGDGSALWRIGELTYLDVDLQAYYSSICADISHPMAYADYGQVEDPLGFAYSSGLAPCAGLARPARPAQGVTGDVPPDVLITGSPRDPLSPFSLIAADPFLVGMGDACSFDLAGHTTYADPTGRQNLLDFIASGVRPC
jgi:pimeloyl-ACP methyl ester carboxylesterase